MDLRDKFPKGIYGILGEAFSLGRSNFHTADMLIKGGVNILQYREKAHEKDRGVMLAECSQIAAMAREAGIPFIVNDFLDIALLSGADGVHLGQEDLPAGLVKKRYPHLMVGCSTHSPEQIAKAIDDQVDYIGVGPVYATQTKKDASDTVGFPLIEHAASLKNIPFTAIGGIKRENINAVAAHGATTFCLISDILGARDIPARLGEIRAIVDHIALEI